jgi:hypothetical protein
MLIKQKKDDLINSITQEDIDKFEVKNELDLQSIIIVLNDLRMVRELIYYSLQIKKMKISIVVPCFNMENFIEESLLSIINQNYLES